MKFVATKTADQLDLQALHRVRAAATDNQTHPCPCCGGRMNIIETFKRGSTPRYQPPPPTAIRIDTS
jgi:hypothetical protein